MTVRMCRQAGTGIQDVRPLTHAHGGYAPFGGLLRQLAHLVRTGASQHKRFGSCCLKIMQAAADASGAAADAMVRSSLSVLVLRISYALESSSKSTSHLLLFSHAPHFPLPFLSPPPLLLLFSSTPPPPMPQPPPLSRSLLMVWQTSALASRSAFLCSVLRGN